MTTAGPLARLTGSIAARTSLAGALLVALGFSAVLAAASWHALDSGRERAAGAAMQQVGAVVRQLDRYDALARDTAARMLEAMRASLHGTLDLDADALPSRGIGRAADATGEVVERFARATGGVAAVFAARGGEFVRVAASPGAQGLGASIGVVHPAYPSLRAGRPHVGRTTLAGRAYMVRHDVVKDGEGRVVGVLVVGVDLAPTMAAVRGAVLGQRLQSSGGLYVVDVGAGASRGELVVHPAAAGRKASDLGPHGPALWAKLESLPSSAFETGPALAEPDGRRRLAVADVHRAWDWLVVGEWVDEEATAVTRRLLAVVWGALAVGVAVLAVALAWVVRRFVGEPIRELSLALEGFGAGDLTRPFATGRTDEIAGLVASLEQARLRMARSLQAIAGSSGSIATASAEVASGNNDLAGRTETQAANLQQTAASIAQLTLTVKGNAENARQANQLALGASEVAERGGCAVASVVQRMDAIQASAHRIAEIVGVIDALAFQTGILALNAAVEAARAGEQGRGFAVVAGEVRALAQRSAGAAREIRSLIAASVDEVDQGSVLVRQAGGTMAEIVSSVRRVAGIIGEISAATGEQSEQLAQVNAAVAQLDQATQQNAALVEESSAAAESLREQARVLHEAVAVFEVEAPRAGALASRLAAPAPAAAQPAPGTPRANGPAPASGLRRPESTAPAAPDDDWETF